MKKFCFETGFHPPPPTLAQTHYAAKTSLESDLSQKMLWLKESNITVSYKNTAILEEDLGVRPSIHYLEAYTLPELYF